MIYIVILVTLIVAALLKYDISRMSSVIADMGQSHTQFEYNANWWRALFYAASTIVDVYLIYKGISFIGEHFSK